MVPDTDEPGRLADLYSKISDAELKQLAADSSSLTDTAQSALTEELRRRGHTVEPPEPDEGYDQPEYRSLVTVRNFRDLPEALLAKGSLESADIECCLVDDNMVRMDWFISNFVGGVKLQVKPEDAAAAIEILDQPIPEDFEVEGSGNYRQPKCPNCDSLDVTFEELNKPVAYTSAYIGLPFPLHRPAWKCHACGREWEDSDPQSDEVP